jgi:putative oxidoreductase
MKRFLFDCGTRDITASAALLVLRALTGSMLLIGHGIPKVQNYSVLKSTFYVPGFLSLSWAPACLLAAISAEVAGSILVILGLAARPAAFVIAFTMVTAAFQVRGAEPWFQNTPTFVETKELAVMYLIPMLAIILGGAGIFSLDATALKERRNRRW